MTGAPEPTALYRLFGDGDVLLYIGISKTFGRRWHQHSRSQPWWPQVRRQSIDWYPGRDEALAAEADAIRAEYPRHNVAHARPRPVSAPPRPAPTPVIRLPVAGMRALMIVREAA